MEEIEEGEKEKDPWEEFKTTVGFSDPMKPYEKDLKSLFEARREFSFNPGSKEKKNRLNAVITELGDKPDDFFEICKPIIERITDEYTIDHLPL